jgi:hypothetical protein
MPEQNFLITRIQRIAAAAACALLLACPASAQIIGSGHVMGNGTSSPRTATDTPLMQIMNQPGSGVTFAGNSGKIATVTGTIPNGYCRSTDANGNDIDAGGACTVGGGGGTVAAGIKGQIAAYNASTNAVVGIPAQCTPFEAWGGSISPSAGSTNVMAFADAVAGLAPQGGCIGFGPGTYTFGSVLAVNLPGSLFNISLSGTGINSTELLFPSGGGLTFHYNSPLNSVRAENFSEVTAASGGSTAIKLTQSSGLGSFERSTFSNISMRGTGGAAHWDWVYDTGGVSGIDIYSPHI